VIVDLPSTSTTSISKRLVRMRNEMGATTLGRVLTLVVLVNETDADQAIEDANDASHQHPCRIVVVIRGDKRGANRLDAQIRVGGDAGASEVVVMRLYGKLADHGHNVVTPLLLPDSPIVAWWPTEAPDDVATSPLGQMAGRRITDAATGSKPHVQLAKRARTYRAGDTDLAWTRVTLWRGLLAAALDQPPYEPVLEATVSGAGDSPSTDLLAAWLALTLKCPVRRTRGRNGVGMTSVRLERKSGPVDLVRPDGRVATLAQTGQPVRRISLARRTTAQCLADELRRLDRDEVYEEVLTKGLQLIDPKKGMPTSEAVAGGEAPSLQQSRRAARAAARRNKDIGSSKMVQSPSPEGKGTARSDTKAVKEAAARKLKAKTESGTKEPGKRDAATKGQGKGST
jgi:glucose-6-phosphate dehydrogenase assembly protein OpcA